MTDFLITFSVDGTQAIRMMEEIGVRATALEAQLNALGQRGAGSAGSASNILNNMGLNPSAIGQSAAAVSGLEAQIANFQARLVSAKELGLPISAGEFKNAAIAANTLSKNLDPTSLAYKNLTASASEWTKESQRLAGQLDETNQSFARHTRRIFEAILIYEAFGRAVQAIQAGIDLVIDIDRESRRLEAVLEIDPTQGGQFIQQLGQIASSTVTPFEDLVSESDRMAAAFSDIEDPVARAAATLELARRAGQLTTVTQRDLGTETQNVIAIMKQLDIPIEQLGDFLGKVTVAGGNASTRISEITDALRVSATAAHESGANLDIFLGILNHFIVVSGRTGSEAGNIFKQLFTKLADPDVIKGVNDITGGVLRLRDSVGNLRDPFDVLFELNSLLEQGVISATQWSDVVDTIAPPLSPQTAVDFKLVLKNLDQISDEVAEIGAADVSGLTDLVDKINDALGPQFQKLIIDAQRAFVELFGPAILVGGQAIIDIIRNLGIILGALPPEVLTVIGVLGTLFVSFKVLQFAISGILSLLGIKGLGAAFSGMASAAVASRGVSLLAGSVSLLGSALRTVLPLLIAFAAIELGSKLIKDAETIQRLRDVGFSDETAQEVVNGPQFNEESRTSGVAGRGFGTSAGGVTDPTLTENQTENLHRLAEALKTFDDQGNLTAETQAAMKAAILDTNGAVSDQLIAFDNIVAAGSGVIGSNQQQTDSYNNSRTAATDYANSLKDVSVAEQQAAEATALLTALEGAQGDALIDLSDRLKEGTIDQNEFAAGEQQVSQAADLASQLVAAYGDKLRTLIPELAGAGEGNDDLAEAVFNMVLRSGDALPAIDNLIQRLISLAVSSAESAAVVVASATTIAAAFQAIASARAAAVGVAFGTGPGGPFMEGLDESQAPELAQGAIDLSGLTAGLDRQIQALFSALRNSFQTAGNTTFGTGIPSSSGGGGGGGGSKGDTDTKEPRQQAVTFDIEDLPKRLIPEMIRIATRLRNQIPNERALSRDEIVALIREGRFLQTVRGVDDRLLRIALERLTEQIEKQNEREEAKARRSALLRNLSVNAGPLGALISQPTAFGVAGSFAAGNGLNFDPKRGNFVINVPVELKGLRPAQLQQLIYNIIAKAIRDGLRL